MEEVLTFEEAELLITLFSDDCDDLNWGLLHAIESVAMRDLEKIHNLISRCKNQEFAKILEVRMANSINSKTSSERIEMKAEPVILNENIYKYDPPNLEGRN